MVKPWDDLMKRLFITSPQQMVQWLVPGAQFVSERTLELKNRTIVADILYNVVVHGDDTTFAFRTKTGFVAVGIHCGGTGV